MSASVTMAAHTEAYAQKLASATKLLDVEALGEAMKDCWQSGNQIFLCGNGGSAGNAIHLANDYIYGAGRKAGRGLRATALSANNAVMTCLANDIGYDAVFAEQLKVLAEKGDILIVLSGSGNSPNIVKALEQAKVMGLRTFAIVGYSGGKAKSMAGTVLHTPIDDMQIAEDMQLVIGHILMQWLCDQNVKIPSQAA